VARKSADFWQPLTLIQNGQFLKWIGIDQVTACSHCLYSAQYQPSIASATYLSLWQLRLQACSYDFCNPEGNSIRSEDRTGKFAVQRLHLNSETGKLRISSDAGHDALRVRHVGVLQWMNEWNWTNLSHSREQPAVWWRQVISSLSADVRSAPRLAREVRWPGSATHLAALGCRYALRLAGPGLMTLLVSLDGVSDQTPLRQNPLYNVKLRMVFNSSERDLSEYTCTVCLHRKMSSEAKGQYYIAI